MTPLLLQQRIKFVPKEANPPSVASLGPIKDCWAALNKAVYDKSWEAISFPFLKVIIYQKACEVLFPMILRLFITIKERLAICVKYGYWAIHR